MTPTKENVMTRTTTLALATLIAALSLSACTSMGHMKKNDIPTDQNPAHDMHKTPGK